MSYCEGVRKWLSVSEASERDLPPVDQRLPEGWDEEDILLDEDQAVTTTTASASPAGKKAAPAPPATIASPKKNAATTVDAAAPSSPGNFPEGFFASPKNKKSAEFPAVNNAKFSQADEDARLKTNAAPSLLAKLAAFLMPQQDGTEEATSKDAAASSPVAKKSSAPAASPAAKLTGRRRSREEAEPSSSSSDDEEIVEGAGGDLETKLNSFSAKQLENKVTSDELKEYARENSLKFNSKAKKGELIILCKNFAKKQQQEEVASVRPSSASPKKQPAAAVPAAVVASSPVKAVVAPAPVVVAVAAPKVRKAPTAEQLSALPPFSVSAGDEPQANWAVTQMKQWAKDNKVNLGDAILKIDILKVCWEAFDKKQQKK